MRSMISARPPKAPTGSPPPMIFPRVVRSGRDTLDLLDAALGKAEAGHHFVEDQDGALPRAGLPQVP